MVADGVGIVQLRDILTTFKPGLVGITMTTFQTKSAREVSAVVKDLASDTVVVVGGPHPSALAAKVLDDLPQADVCVIGEGEQAIVDIAEGKDWADINGICYRHGVSPARRQVADLDSLPLPNLDLINLRKFRGPYPPARLPSMYIMTSRGCSFRCVFCSKSVFGNTVRYKSPERVIEEIKWLRGRWGVKEIFFYDDTFNLDQGRLEQILRLIIANKLNKDIVYRAYFRANRELIDEDLLKQAREAGFWLIFYGVESGNQGVLDEMKQSLHLDEIKRAFKLTHEAGLKTVASFILGLPGETNETVRESFALCSKLKPFWARFTAAAPYPGTELEKMVRKNGYILIRDYDEYRVGKILARTDALSFVDLEAAYKKAYRKTYWHNIRNIAFNPQVAYRAIRQVM